MSTIKAPYKRYYVGDRARGYRPSRTMRQYILKRDNYTCQVCKRDLSAVRPTRRNVAHIVPWPEGKTEVDNLRLLCVSCNHRERRSWGKGHEGQVYGHATGDASIRVIMANALAR